jgi:hypothetical protein
MSKTEISARIREQLERRTDEQIRENQRRIAALEARRRRARLKDSFGK